LEAEEKVVERPGQEVAWGRRNTVLRTRRRRRCEQGVRMASVDALMVRALPGGPAVLEV